MAQPGRSGNRRFAWETQHFPMALCSACTFPKLTHTHWASSKVWQCSWRSMGMSMLPKCMPSAKASSARRVQLLAAAGVCSTMSRILLWLSRFWRQGASQKSRGFQVIFLPKFHCKLNFIEQCWGYSKRVYRQCLVSSKEEDLEKNVLNPLESVPLESMRRFARRSHCFMDGYRQGLNGKQAAWAAKKYRGHRVLPESILKELEEARVS